ncbi:MAG: pantoate--beta-alanine ligase [Bacteroidetes bacterium]|nr:MAG: pantoate--beta-alanine ligase [Bacteroidota bacterium]
MKLFKDIDSLQLFVDDHRKKKLLIGFVPTMGALHEGHLSLVRKALESCDIVIASVFVNPTQFNNREDFEKYPLSPEKDCAMLAEAGCHGTFLPTEQQIYPDSYQAPEVPLGVLDQVLEGAFRPGHFQGVVEVVYRLFDLVRPDQAFFGLKDFQQLAVIRRMTREMKLPIEIVSCPTIRDNDGLAMSSRNQRLSSEERKMALSINESLTLAKQLSESYTPSDLKIYMEGFYQKSGLKLEYFEMIDPQTFEVLDSKWVPGTVACVAAYAGAIRLIDNQVVIP